MAFGLIPRYQNHAKKILNTRKSLKSEQAVQRVMNTVSMETTWAFESSMDQLDSMNARGYGVKKRTHFHLFTWERKDWIHIAEIVILMTLNLWAYIHYYSRFFFYPMIIMPAFQMRDLLWLLMMAFQFYYHACGRRILMYEINNLTFRYMLSDRNSLEQVSLKIKKGKITLIAGPSGSGKTTLLRHLKKELLPKGKRSGKVLYDGQEIEQLKDLQSVKEVGYLFQNPSAQMVMDTVWHEIAFGLENLGMPYEQMKRTVAEIVNYFDLQKIYHEDTDKLSGGQKQLVNLAAVMAMHPKVLILDEPTAQLDPAARKDFLVMLQKLHKEFGLTIILTSHNLEDVMEMSDECVILDDGKVIEQGNPKEVARHLQKIHHPLEQSLPQILRLEEKFQIELTFSMEEAREQIRKKEYQLIKKTHFEGKTVLSISHLYAGYEKGKRCSFESVS